MKNIEQMQASVLQWEKANGIVTTIDRARFLVDCEVAEYHEAKGEAKLFELGDWFFTAVQLDRLAKEEGRGYYSSLTDCANIIRQKAAEKHVYAVIQSNWTKYVQAKYTNMDKMSQEAVRVAEKYKGRYKQVVPIRSGDYYFIRGLEEDAQGEWHEKVLKPSTFIKAKEFI